MLKGLVDSKVTFQNILCYCLTSTLLTVRVQSKISKHPMLLFNGSVSSRLSFPPTISKHPMLLFNEVEAGIKMGTVEFQNILCYCLTYGALVQNVEKNIFQNILCYCLTLTALPAVE